MNSKDKNSARVASKQIHMAIVNLCTAKTSAGPEEKGALRSAIQALQAANNALSAEPSVRDAVSPFSRK